MATEINNDQFEEQEKFEEAKGQNNVEEDSDYFTFDNIRKMAIDCEYGEDVDPNDEMNPGGSYKLNLGDLTDTEVSKKREEVYNYFALNKCLNSMEFNETFPHLKYLKKAGVMSNLRARYNPKGRLLGIDFKPDKGGFK